MSEVKLFQGDCLEVMPSLIDDGVRVDMILTDPPYGTMKGGAYMLEWDTLIEPTTIFEWANNLLRQNGKMLLFSQQPYTSQLILNTIPRIQFIQTLYWYKHTMQCNILRIWFYLGKMGMIMRKPTH